MKSFVVWISNTSAYSKCVIYVFVGGKTMDVAHSNVQEGDLENAQEACIYNKKWSCCELVPYLKK